MWVNLTQDLSPWTNDIRFTIVGNKGKHWVFLFEKLKWVDYQNSCKLIFHLLIYLSFQLNMWHICYSRKAYISLHFWDSKHSCTNCYLPIDLCALQAWLNVELDESTNKQIRRHRYTDKLSSQKNVFSFLQTSCKLLHNIKMKTICVLIQERWDINTNKCKDWIFINSSGLLRNKEISTRWLKSRKNEEASYEFWLK